MKNRQEALLYNKIQIGIDVVTLENEPNVYYKIIDAVWYTSVGGFIKLNKFSKINTISRDNFVPLSHVITINDNYV
jgi:hypothetical protein